MREFAKETPFAKIVDRARKFALVKLESSGLRSCWILEFGRPDNFSISTLLRLAAVEITPYVPKIPVRRHLASCRAKYLPHSVCRKSLLSLGASLVLARTAVV